MRQAVKNCPSLVLRPFSANSFRTGKTVNLPPPDHLRYQSFNRQNAKSCQPRPLGIDSSSIHPVNCFVDFAPSRLLPQHQKGPPVKLVPCLAMLSRRHQPRAAALLGRACDKPAPTDLLSTRLLRLRAPRRTRRSGSPGRRPASAAARCT